MKAKLKDLVLRLLKEHRVMTIATNRPDGWPLARGMSSAISS